MLHKKNELALWMSRFNKCVVLAHINNSKSALVNALEGRVNSIFVGVATTGLFLTNSIRIHTNSGKYLQKTVSTGKTVTFTQDKW